MTDSIQKSRFTSVFSNNDFRSLFSLRFNITFFSDDGENASEEAFFASFDSNDGAKSVSEKLRVLANQIELRGDKNAVVDLNELKEFDCITLADGSNHVVDDVEVKPGEAYPYVISFAGGFWTYDLYGHPVGGDLSLRIVKITPAEHIANEAMRLLKEDDEGSQSDEADMVNHPPHYNSGSVECIEAIKAALTPEEFEGYCKGNAMKYIWRHNLKGEPKEQIAKAQWYLGAME